MAIGSQDIGVGCSTKSPELEIDEGALGADGVRDLLHFEFNRLARDRSARTSFHLLICSSLQMPGAFVYPPACGEMKVASVIRRPPGMEEARCE